MSSDTLTDHIGRSSALRLSVEWPTRGVVVVRMSGEIDLSAVPRLTELIRQRLSAANLSTVVLDFEDVSFCSSAGLELLLHAQRRAEYRGIDLYVISGKVVGRLLRIAGLDGRFACRDSAAEAVTQARS